MSAHTHGPWAVTPVNERYESHIWQTVPGSVLLASVHGLNHQANARIIAAAPALLEALERFSRCAAVREATQSTDIGLSNAADYARAAIAAARGQS